jgi:hypothetical protein
MSSRFEEGDVVRGCRIPVEMTVKDVSDATDTLRVEYSDGSSGRVDMSSVRHE